MGSHVKGSKVGAMRTLSLDHEDQLSAVEINGANVFPLHRLERLIDLLDLAEKPSFAELKGDDVVTKLYPAFFERWQADQRDSYLAFKGMTHILKGSLMLSTTEPWMFHRMVQLGGDRTVEFLKAVVPYMIDSEMVQGTNAIDLLLTNLAAVTVLTGHNYLLDFINSVPFFSGYYLGVYQKQFEELYTSIGLTRSVTYDDEGHASATVKPHYLTCMHLPARKIIVSNAPPVKLHRSTIYRKQRKYSCEMSAGGLVSGIKPSLEATDVWVSYLDPGLIGLDRMPVELPGRIFKESVRIPPQYRRTTSLSLSNTSDEDGHEFEDFLWEKAENDFLSLQDRLKAFAEQNFQVNPLVILRDDHRGFYNGISNGLFWPAFHGLYQYIIDEYKSADSRSLVDDWLRYIKVNYHFSIHTARSCRSQDFIWIHDYHLILVGLILRSLDSAINCGFFLHIPFAINDEFMSTYTIQGIAVLRGLLGFRRVGFQTRNDCENYVKLVLKYIPGSTASEKLQWPKGQGYTVTYQGWVTDVGTFPISVKLDAVFKISNNAQMPQIVAKLRNKILGNTLVSSVEDMTVFLSVERFDYTKGIIERLGAIDQYFKNNPDAIGKHVFYQIAATSRADVSSYKEYQNSCVAIAESVNKKYKKTATIDGCDREWVPIILDTKNNPYENVIALYKVADVVVATPVIDGMNLVVKEAVLSNPSAVFVFSSGPGAVKQFADAGLSHCYLLVPDIANGEVFAKRLSQATKIGRAAAKEHGRRLFEFVTQHDIGHWIATYTNPDWTQDVVQMPIAAEKILSLDFLRKLVGTRRDIIRSITNARHVGEAEEMSLNNMLKAVELYSSRNELQLSVGSETIAVNPGTIVAGIKLDLEFLKSFWLADQLCTIQDVFQASAGMPENIFKSQLQSVQNFFKTIDSIDVLIVSYEELCVTPGAYGFEHSNKWSHYEIAQTFTSSILMSRFAWRMGATLALLSHLSISELEETTCFEQGIPPVFSDSSQNDATLVQGKKVGLIASPGSCVQLTAWLSEHVEGLYLIPTKKPSHDTAKVKVISPSAFSVFSCPEVFYALCAAKIQEPVVFSLARPEVPPRAPRPADS